MHKTRPFWYQTSKKISGEEAHPLPTPYPLGTRLDTSVFGLVYRHFSVLSLHFMHCLKPSRQRRGVRWVMGRVVPSPATRGFVSTWALQAAGNAFWRIFQATVLTLLFASVWWCCKRPVTKILGGRPRFGGNFHCLNVEPQLIILETKLRIYKLAINIYIMRLK